MSVLTRSGSPKLYRRLAERERLTLGGLPRSQHLGQQDVPRFIEFGGRYGFRLEFVEFREGRLFGVRRRFSARRDYGQVEQPGVIAQIGARARARRDLLTVHQRLIHAVTIRPVPESPRRPAGRPHRRFCAAATGR